jgi:aminopeptidase I
MTKNAPGLRKAASNADLYSDPSPPASRPLRHAYSTLSRAHTTASLSHRSRGLRNWYDDEPPSRHSVAAPYANLIDADEDYGGMVRQEQQSPPPVPPKILEESGAEKPESKVQMEDLKRLRDAERRDAMKVAEIQHSREVYNRRKIGYESSSGPPQARSHPWAVSTQAVSARSKEGPEKYTKPFTDFMTSMSLPTTNCWGHPLISRRQSHRIPCCRCSGQRPREGWVQEAV